MMRTVDMKVLRNKHGKTLHDIVIIEYLRQQIGAQDIGRSERPIRIFWDKHIKRTDDARKCQTEQPIRKKNAGRHPKRWTSSSEEDLLGLNRQ